MSAQDDLSLLRHSFAVAKEARRQGNHPFGAVLAGPEGEVLMEQGNAYFPDQDRTAHAERVLMTRASRAYRPEFLQTCTIYVSAEPCAMCAGSIYWAGVGRVVYGMAERALKSVTGNHQENPTLDLPCRTVFSAGQRHVEVVGPLLETEAAQLQFGAWVENERAKPEG